MIHDQRPPRLPSMLFAGAHRDLATGGGVTTTLDDDKRRLRRAAEERRRALASAPGAGEAMAELFVGQLSLPAESVVSGYWPMRDEMDPRPLLQRLAADGHPLCLPVVEGPARPLSFRAWRPGDALVEAAYGTRVPDPAAPSRQPSALLVPLLAYDGEGYRLGYGGGFYDRTLAALRRAGPCLAIGLAYDGQEVERLPRNETDARLDWIVTEARALHWE